MTRRLEHVAVVLTVLLAWARPAQAVNIWDLLEQLSGPGPFDARALNVLLSGGCLAALSDDQELAALKADDFRFFGLHPDTAKRPALPCFYFDRRPFDARADGRFAAVDATAYEFGVTFPVLRPVEVGAGLGWIHFESKGVKRNQFAGTPLRVVFKPGLLFATQNVRDEPTKKWLGFLKYYVRLTVINGMAGQDFGVSNLVFDERGKHNFLTSAGFIIDAIELVGRFR